MVGEGGGERGGKQVMRLCARAARIAYAVRQQGVAAHVKRVLYRRGAGFHHPEMQDTVTINTGSHGRAVMATDRICPRGR